MCHHLFIPLLEESRVAHDQTETRPRSRQPDERTDERDRARVGQSDLRRAAERSNDKLRNYPFLGYRRMYVLILLHFDS